ncbi:NupC/NupG family nucleoside CNT transporter [Streptomyces sp. NPDC051704]|uniref:NupC/NupG family nucleoside CNT transporter n=1 Tax=Streptomyces sp. NPDC051704 TaxID=3365671 RepID=UPI0037A74A18
MSRLQGLLGLLVIYGLCFAISRHRRQINWRTLGIGLALQVGFALLVLKWEPGREALRRFADMIAKLIGYTTAGTEFLFGSLAKGSSVPFAIGVLPVIIFLGALVGLLYYLRVIQWVVQIVGGAISRLLRTSRVESIWATTVIFLGQSEAPLVIAPYLRRLTQSELFTCMTGGFASVAGSTLVGYSLLGAPLPYLLAASIMNAPAMLVIAKAIYPETDVPEQQGDVRDVRDTESANVIDALARGALSGGRLAVIVGCLLIAFVALIALANGILGVAGSWFGIDDLTFQRVLGWLFAPIAWLIGVPWDEASTVGSLLGQKTVINEFVAFASFGPQIPSLDPKTVLITTFALAGFANFGSIAIQLGSFGSLAPERRGDVARLGLLALLAGTLANLSNAAIVGIVG